MPIFLAIAGVLGLRLARRSGLGSAIREYGLPLLLLVPVAIYWAVDLLPANLGYFANPATAADGSGDSTCAGSCASIRSRLP